MKIVIESLFMSLIVNVPMLYIIRDHSFQDNAIVVFLLVVYLIWGFSLGYRSKQSEKAKKHENHNR